MRQLQFYDGPSLAEKAAAMFLSFILSRLSRRPAFTWRPSLDLSDNTIYSTLIPGTQY